MLSMFVLEFQCREKFGFYSKLKAFDSYVLSVKCLVLILSMIVLEFSVVRF